MNRLSSPSKYAIRGATSSGSPDLLIHLSEGKAAVLSVAAFAIIGVSILPLYTIV
jgi:hypothetical protein